LFHLFSSLSHAPAPPRRYSPSLHDALPIYERGAVDPRGDPQRRQVGPAPEVAVAALPGGVLEALEHVHVDVDGQQVVAGLDALRSEEHTSELQSRENLVCRLLLEKKKKKKE